MLFTAQQALLRVVQRLADDIKKTTDEARWTEGLITSRLELLEAYWDDFQANHVQLLHDHADEGHAYFEEDYYRKAETAYVTSRGILYDARSNIASAAPRALTGTNRLPRIAVPPFSDDRREWKSFKDLFRSIIHQDESLINVEKLYYLKTLVRREGKRALDSLATTDGNYATAWAALEARYDNARLLVPDHISALLRIPRLKGESGTELQRLLDSLSQHRDQLLALKRPVNEWDDWFVCLAATAMDPVMRRDWEEELQLKEFTIGEARTTHATFAERFPPAQVQDPAVT